MSNFDMGLLVLGSIFFIGLTIYHIVESCKDIKNKTFVRKFKEKKDEFFEYAPVIFLVLFSFIVCIYFFGWFVNSIINLF